MINLSLIFTKDLGSFGVNKLRSLGMKTTLTECGRQREMAKHNNKIEKII